MLWELPPTFCSYIPNGTGNKKPVTWESLNSPASLLIDLSRAANAFTFPHIGKPGTRKLLTKSHVDVLKL